MPFLQRLNLSNFLSFRSGAEWIELGPLNVVIGPNGSGKSNLIEAVSVLKSLPNDFKVPFRKGGGFAQWLHKAAGDDPMTIEAIVENSYVENPLRYRIVIGAEQGRPHVVDEQIVEQLPSGEQAEARLFFQYENGIPVLYDGGVTEKLEAGGLNRELSLLAQYRDPTSLPVLTQLGFALERIGIYRDWSIGRVIEARSPQPADLPNDFLTEDGKNLGLMLNRFRRESKVKNEILDSLKKLYEGIEDFDVVVEGGTVQVMLQERSMTIPAARLSDGTLRYLSLLCLLHHPSPPRLTCIEEPELGLHPDILPYVADLLRDASDRTQLLVTTHSDVLVDALNDVPEAILVCEKEESGTQLRRLDRQALSEWLAKYTLGQLWRSGELGGNRW